ncbi:SGNH/GDSL hydrolase family protein [Mucilaginibacter terrae]|uniref:Lysophospholipase L1-like esterase n=1 Tax=Mucilaginibacter terrae TaxID=1955052 RepID=A0ABU3GSE1_9SPHI|nr:SGNH/GDSL hydrolase family protein [Mucilaginibacter terrae]MDT3402689.1 lysophospholipase L1-like esterase [Mucilaginibacter terrae]
MKFKNYKNIFFAGLLTLAACKPEIDVAPATSGSADFSTYIAIGDSQTAGFADGGLYRSGQINSFANIIAQQMKSAGGGNFSQPLFTEAQANGSGFKKLTGFDSNGSPILTDVPAAAVRTPGFPFLTKYSGDNNNFGIPGLKVIHAGIAGYGNANPYFERLLTASYPTANDVYLNFATAKPYTFFTCWLGSNDALGYATSGGAGDVLTDKATFTAAFTAVIEKLTTGGKKGAVATIPDVSTIPYFTTVTIPALLAGIQKVAPTVTTLYVSARKDDGTYAARAATASDLVVLTFPTSKMGVNGYGVSPLNPIENQYILDPNEVALVRDYVASYNQTINSVAASKGLAVFDVYTFLNNLKQKGLIIDGASLNANYISGGVFSLDGVHLTPRGYAIVANEFIKAINTKYGSTLPQVNISGYAGVVFP